MPIGLDVTGGEVVGVPPPHATDVPAPKLALAGLVPNPASRGGAVRVAFTLGERGAGDAHRLRRARPRRRAPRDRRAARARARSR